MRKGIVSAALAVASATLVASVEPVRPVALANRTNWRFVSELSDEFDCPSLDRTKWDDWCATFPGRRASGRVGDPCVDGFMFSPDNVRVDNGELVLTERFVRPDEMKGRDGYLRHAPYAGAIVKSVKKQRYGYFEIRAKVMKSCVSNAFWLYDPFSDDLERKFTAGDWSEEIDIFETKGGDDFGGRQMWGVGSHIMNLHFYKTPYLEGVVNRAKHYPEDISKVVNGENNLADAYHVYAFCWTPERLEWYLDGKLNFSRENRGLFRRPLHVTLDCEVFVDWFGIPDPATLPAEFRIDYVRVWAPPEIDETTEPEELRVRGGLGNAAAKLAAGGPFNVCYFGGSITDAANGWREKSFAWLKKRCKAANLREIKATICGTGADFGAARFKTDVLSQGVPDLLFVEFRVNGGTRSGVEGIVRQALKANPKMDICFVYTVSEGMVDSIREGRLTGFGCQLEEVARHYDIPSIDFGPAVVRACDLGILAFSSASAANGKVLFTKDGVHPTLEGHDFCQGILARTLTKLLDGSPIADRRLKDPIEQFPRRCAEVCELVPVERILENRSGWSRVDATTDAMYTDDAVRTAEMLRGAFVADEEGASFAVRFCGTALVFSDIPQDEPVVLSVSVDGTRPYPIVRQRTDQSRYYARFWRVAAPDEAYGDHVVCVKVAKMPEGARFYCGQVQVLGGVFRPHGTCEK